MVLWKNNKIISNFKNRKNPQIINKKEVIIIDPTYSKRIRNVMHNLCQYIWQFRRNVKFFERYKLPKQTQEKNCNLYIHVFIFKHWICNLNSFHEEIFRLRWFQFLILISVLNSVERWWVLSSFSERNNAGFNTEWEGKLSV